MRSPNTPEQTESSLFSPRSTRSRIAAAMIGLAGSAVVPTALPACKASISVSAEVNLANQAREKILKTKFIIIGNPGAVIVFDKVETDAGIRLKALMRISSSSRLHQVTNTVREYSLPEDADPWSRMVVEPSGRISLRTKHNQIALVFKCQDLEKPEVTSCLGADKDPVALDAQIAAFKDHAFKDRIATAEKATWERKQKAARKAEADARKEPATDAVVDKPLTTGHSRQFETTAEIAGILAQLEPALKARGYDYQKSLATRLVNESWATPWREETEAFIKEIDNDSGASGFINKTKGLMIQPIDFLLAHNPRMIRTVADELGVQLKQTEKPKETSETDRTAFLRLINQLRAENNLPPVEYGDCPQKMADSWAMNEEAQATGKHAVGNDTPDKRAKHFGCQSPWMENIAVPTSAEANSIYTMWLNSPGHKANMLNAGISTIGLRCVSGPKIVIPGNYFCVLNGTNDSAGAQDAGGGAGADAGANISEQTATEALQEIRSTLNSADLEKIKSTARMITVPPFNEIDAGSKEQVLPLINDWLGQHYESKDYKTIMAVLHFLKGGVTEEDQKHIQETYGHGIPD